MTWVDFFLSADEDPRLRIGEIVLNGRELRERVLAREGELGAAGIDDTAVVVLGAAPGVDFVTSFLAVLRSGAQLALLDHRFPPAIVREVERRLSATHTIASAEILPAMRCFTRSVVLVRQTGGGGARFITSRFAPVVFDAAARVLAAVELTEVERGGMLVLLLTPRGDTETRAAVLAAIEEGRRLSPLLFVQSTPSSIVGKVAKEWGIRGSITTVSTRRAIDDPVILEMAEELLHSDEAPAVLVLREIPPTEDSDGMAEAAVLTSELR